MKRILIIILFLGSINLVKGQFLENNAVYLSSGLNLGNYFGGTLGINYVYKEKYSMQMSFTGNIRKAQNSPVGYSSGMFSVIFLGTDQPYEHFDSYNLLAGRIFKLNKQGTLRLNLHTGVGYTQIKEPHNWKQLEYDIYGIPLLNNYTWENKKQNEVSLVLNPKIEFVSDFLIGCYASGQLIVNRNRTYVGLGLGMMLGSLRDKK